MVKNDFLKANPNTSQAITNAIVHAMQWLKTASIDDIIKSLPPSYYKSDEKLYRISLEKNMSAFQWDGLVTPEAAKNVLDFNCGSRSGAQAGKDRFQPDLRQQTDRNRAEEISLAGVAMMPAHANSSSHVRDAE